MDRQYEQRDEDLVDLGAATIETKGNVGAHPDIGSPTQLGSGISNED